MTKVFLGGTCNGSTWRDKLIPMLKIDYFNPVVENWSPEMQDIEDQEKEKADFRLYVITPKMTGVYAIAELIDDSNKIPEKMLFCFLVNDEGQEFSVHQVKSLAKTKQMAMKNGATTCSSLKEIAAILNCFSEDNGCTTLQEAKTLALGVNV